MEPEKWNAIKEGFNAAMECEAGRLGAVLSGLAPEIRPEVEKLIDNYDKACDFIEAPVFGSLGLASDDAIIGAEFDGYRLVEQIGTGGMGAVYLAEHVTDDVSHRVALKLVKRGMDTNAVLSRFYRERRILAGLEHPNIARFLDAGAAPDGRPYIVMEYVEGISIRRYCERLSVKECLELFRKVCTAVSFAHRNLVVHRDIKPSNIIVTKEGEPKLLDFGIAKLLQNADAEDGTEPTATIFRALTPDYASPEQLAGAKVTTATDVYSLGVVLYELLTGRRPFSFDRGGADDAVKKISTTEPPRPSSVVSGKPPGGPDTETVAAASTDPKALIGDLDNITLKALQADPERRYVSVEELSEDVRRHLQGLPVKATAATFTYRAAKFVRRHQAGVIAAAAAGIILLASTSFSVYQAYRAERERAKAEQRFADVRQLANSLVFDVNEAIIDVPGTLKARELIVSRALEYLDKLAAESDDDPQLQSELAVAYEKIGDVQNGSYASNLGDLDAAFASFRKAIELHRAVHERDPSNVRYRLRLAFAHLKLGIAGWTALDAQMARQNCEKSVELFDSVLRDEPTDTPALLESTRATAFLVQVMAFQGEVDASIAKARANAERVADPRLDGTIDQATLNRERSRAYSVLAEILSELSNGYDEARDLYIKSMELDRNTMEMDPENTTGQRELYLAHIKLATIHALLGEKAAALDNARNAMDGFRRLASADPANDAMVQAVSYSEMVYGRLLVHFGAAGEAVEPLLESVKRLTPSAASSSADDSTRYRLSGSRLWLAAAYIRRTPVATAANCAAARDHLEESREFFVRIKAEGKLIGLDANFVELADELAGQCSAAWASR